MDIKELEKELEALKSANVLWGKSLIACGDSFTEGDFTGFVDSEGKSGKESDYIFDKEWGVYKTYPWWIARRNNMRLKNLAKCGGTIAITKEHIAEPDKVERDTRRPFSNLTYKNLGDDVDYILIMYGLNDSFHTNLGTIDDGTNETFYGAWNVVYKYLIERYPTAKIGAIVCNGGLKTEYANAVRETAEKWGIPYLDLQRDKSVPATLGKEGMGEEAYKMRYDYFRVAKNNGHPNLEAHKYMSSYVEDFLRKL